MPSSSALQSSTESEYLSSRQVRARFGGRSDMTLHRWLKKPELNFPRPIYICGKRFWVREELTRWEESQAAKRPQQSVGQASNA